MREAGELIAQYLASPDTKDAVVDGLTPEVRRQLVDLMALKSIAKDEYSLEKFQQALDAIDGKAPASSV